MEKEEDSLICTSAVGQYAGENWPYLATTFVSCISGPDSKEKKKVTTPYFVSKNWMWHRISLSRHY